MSINVMTFNIRGSFYTHDGDNIWSNRSALNVRTIRAANPDIIGFQELHTGNLATYLAGLPDYRFVLGPPSDENEVHDYNPIFWKDTRFNFQDTGGFYLSESPDHWSRYEDSACIRAATWVTLHCPESNSQVLVLNTHLDHISESSRVAGSRLILETLAQLSAGNIPVIAMGDFNCNPWTPNYGVPTNQTSTDKSYRLFIEQGFVDTYLAAGNVDSMQSYTHHGFDGDTYSALGYHMAWRLDWILTKDASTRRLRTLSSEIIRDAEPPLYPSDHYPVVAQLAVEAI